MLCLRATSQPKLAKQWIRALHVLRVGVTEMQIEATGDWECKDGNVAFLTGSHTPIIKIDRQWCTLMAADGPYRAKPCSGPDHHGARGMINITWTEE
jgi:hypothetical protein